MSSTRLGAFQSSRRAAKWLLLGHRLRRWIHDRASSCRIATDRPGRDHRSPVQTAETCASATFVVVARESGRSEFDPPEQTWSAGEAPARCGKTHEQFRHRSAGARPSVPASRRVSALDSSRKAFDADCVLSIAPYRVTCVLHE